MKTMKTKNSKNNLLSVISGLALILAVPLLFTNCGTSKRVVETSADSALEITGSQEPEIRLQDDCALLHIYRKSSMAGAAISYDVHLNNDKIFRATNKSKTTIKITKEGMNTLWAKTEAKSEIPINIQLGKEYYIRCGIKMGALVGRPKIEVVDNHTGKSEFEKIQAKKK